MVFMFKNTLWIQILISWTNIYSELLQHWLTIVISFLKKSETYLQTFILPLTLLGLEKRKSKELSLWNKIKYLNLNIFRTRCCKPLIFQTQIIWSYRIHSLKYLRSATFGSKDKVIGKLEFVAKTQFLF